MPFKGRLVSGNSNELPPAIAMCATPAVAKTPHYYAAVMTSEAAKRGYGLWAPLSLRAGFDVVLIAVALPLLVAFIWARPRAWELAAAAGLAGLTVHAGRDGVWLLLFLAPPAAKAIRLRANAHEAVVPAIALVLVVVGALAFLRGPSSAGASDRLVLEAIGEFRGPATMRRKSSFSANTAAAPGSRMTFNRILKERPLSS